MIERKTIEHILRANGLQATSSDEQIREVLISAKWHDDDVDAAITVLRENATTGKTKTDSLHKIFRSDDRLKPETVTSLLGIDMDLSSHDIAQARSQKREIAASQIIIIAFISIAVAAIIVLGTMWFLQIGIFYPSL